MPAAKLYRLAVVALFLTGCSDSALKAVDDRDFRSPGAALTPATTAPAAAGSIKERWKSLHKGMRFNDVVGLLGPATRVDDLRGGFFALSPDEDMFLRRY